MAPSFWTTTNPAPRRAESTAAAVEAAGWDGLTFTDSQNLSGDVYVALGLAARATTRIGLGPGVTNPVTRHPAATASAIATVQILSEGRAVLGIGRGDSALFHLGLEPAPVADFERYLAQVQGYLRGEAVDLDGFASRIRWLGESRRPKVPVDVAATGPRVIAAAARHADRITFSMGANPERLRAGIVAARAARAAAGLDPASLTFGAYLNVAPHEDAGVARDLVRGRVAVMAHFSGMAGSTGQGVAVEDRKVFEALHAGYDRDHHTENVASHSQALDPDFLDRFAVVGPPAVCVAKLAAVVAAGIERLVVIGPSRDAEPRQADRSNALFLNEVLPALRGRPTRSP
jgi:5,10-methylenetetrahydromethanopterin reductase